VTLPWRQAPRDALLLLAVLLLPLAGISAVAERDGGPPGPITRDYDARIAFNAGFRATPLPGQGQALRDLDRSVPDLAVEQDQATGAVRTLSSRTDYLSLPSVAEPSEVATGFLAENGLALGLDAASLEYGPAERATSEASGTTRIVLQQRHAGLEVEGARIQVNVNREGRVLGLTNSFLPGLEPTVDRPEPQIALAAAARAAAALDADLRAGAPAEGRLVWLPVRQGIARLVWNFQLRSARSGREYDFTVDAVSGKVWTRFERAGTAPGCPGQAQLERTFAGAWRQAMSQVAARLSADWGTAPASQDPGGNAGNERLLLYAAEGRRNAGCAQTITALRDGLIQAAIDNHGGEDVCRIWEAFAASGLGTDAAPSRAGSEVPTLCGGGLSQQPLAEEPRSAGGRERGAIGVTGAAAESSPAEAPVAALATGGVGAPLPYVELQAENAATNGTILGPSSTGTTYGTVQHEAAFRKAVRLSAAGQFVQFTTTAATNSIVIRYSIPDSASGAPYTAPLGFSINGVAQPDFTLTNRYMYLYGGYPFTNTPGTNMHWFFDEVHRLLPTTYPAGTTFRLQVNTLGASSYTIDFADFELVGAPLTQPAGSVSVTSHGADASGVSDSTGAFRAAIAAAGPNGAVWIPQGTFRVTSHIAVNNIAIRGAGMWYSTVKGPGVGFYGNFPPTPSSNVRMSNFLIEGDVQDRCDSCPLNGIGGAFNNSTFDHLWIEHTKVGAWLDGPFTGTTLSYMRIRNQIADAVNFHGGVTNSSVTNSDIRNTGDDGLAMWSDAAVGANNGNSFTNNTVSLQSLANGIAIYGGTNTTVSGNKVVDTGLQQGGGIHVGQRFNSTPLGTTTISGNTIIRSGSLDQNWLFGVGALWFDARDAAMNGPINVSNFIIQQSPYEAIQTVSGASVGTINFNDGTITGVGTYVVQGQVGGTLNFTNVTASGWGAPQAVYNCVANLVINNLGGNGAWPTSVNNTNCGVWPTPVWPPYQAEGNVSISPTSLNFGSRTTGTTSPAQPVTVTNNATAAQSIAVSITGDYAQTNSCGASLAAGASCTVNVTFTPTATGTRTGTLTVTVAGVANPVSLTGTGTPPGPALTPNPTSLAFASTVVGSTSAAQSVTVTNTGTASASISSIVSTGDFAQTNTCGTSLAVSASCTINVTFTPTAGGARTGAVTLTSNATNGPTSISLSGAGLATTTNVALGRPTSSSGEQGGFPSTNATDGNANTYWESVNNAFPQWLQVDLGSSLPLARVVLKLPPSSAWATRTQTLSVQGSTNGTTFTTLVSSATYTFNPATANTVTITFPTSTQRYVRINFTANSGWPAGQASELEVYPGSGGGGSGATLLANPSSLAFGSTLVGATSAAQTVTVQNTGASAASVSSIAVSGDFAQTNTCGTSIAAGASCTASVTFRPTATGTRTGTLTLTSNASNSPTTVSLTGTGVSIATNLALGKTMSASSTQQTYVAANANDDNTSTYWESANNAFPQWLQVDLGASTTVGRIVVTLPPPTAWTTRTQTLSVLGSTSGSTFTTIVASAGYVFNPATGNSVTITFPATSWRYLRLNFTANTGWPAGQASEVRVYTN
jgi:F5/8 type C domain/Fungalysin metallopeptidase (M36)/Abnormal spindle-like microcephaly-assoc'd, ASPM-SPD-2-Hydin/Fungalysin/Thermolysin Propeptide Motif